MLFVLAVAPGLYILWYFHHADKYKNESPWLLFGTFVLGAVFAIVSIFLEPKSAPNVGILATFAFFLFQIASVEELAKFAAVRILAYRSPQFDEAMDGIIFGIAAAMGFATVENIGYVFELGAGVGILRAFVSVPAHAFYGAIMGYYLAEAKIRRRPLLAVWGLVAAMLLHALFDTLAMRAGLFALIVLPALIWFIYVGVVKKEIAKAQAESLYAPRPSS